MMVKLRKIALIAKTNGGHSPEKYSIIRPMLNDALPLLEAIAKLG